MTLSPAKSSGKLSLRIFDPVFISFISMPNQPDQSAASSSPNADQLAVWTSGSKLVAAVGAFGTSLLLQSFNVSQMAHGLAGFVDMRTCKPAVGFASLFILSTDNANTLSWYEMTYNGTLNFVQSLQSDSVTMIRCRTLAVHCDTQIVAIACNDGVFVVKFSPEQRSLVSGKPLLAQDSYLFATYLMSITSLSFASRSDPVPLIVAASHSKGFICSIGLQPSSPSSSSIPPTSPPSPPSPPSSPSLSPRSYNISGVVDVVISGFTNYFRWIRQPSDRNEIPLLTGFFAKENPAHTDSYFSSIDNTLYVVTFSSCTSSGPPSPAARYAMNNFTKAWVSLGILVGSVGACSASFCDGGIGQRFLAIGVNQISSNYVQSSFIYQQSTSGGLFSGIFTWDKVFPASTKGARDIASVRAPHCIFVIVQESDGGSTPGPFPALLVQKLQGTWSSTDSNMYVGKSGPISISSTSVLAPTTPSDPVKTSSSSMKNSRFFSALNPVVGLMIFRFSDFDPCFDSFPRRP